MVLVRDSATSEGPSQGEEAGEKKVTSEDGAALNLAEEGTAGSYSETVFRVHEQLKEPSRRLRTPAVKGDPEQTSSSFILEQIKLLLVCR